MHGFQSSLMDVWREVGRHIEMEEGLRTLAPILSRDFPLRQLLVRRLNLEQEAVETLGCGMPGADALWRARTVCPAAAFRRLLAWCRGDETALWGRSDEQDRVRKYLVPEGVGEEVLGVSLHPASSPPGALLLAADRGERFTARHCALAEALRDPLSAALENDRRLHEMAVLREAAEADKQSLLRRLGRREIGDAVVGADGGLRAVMQRVELVARSDVPVLIVGETGSGKEVVARAIHSRSPRSAGAFIRVNSGAIPHELIDSHLFGHERGAFTGAVERRRGCFEQADGGTLLLDEIGELSPAAQVRLLRVLQDGWLQRVGGENSIHVDVRLIAATNRDLTEMVREGRFREDLWYRIAVFPILLPPLRERAADIDEMARHFARKAATRFGLPEALPTETDLRLLRAYTWPGNVRELAAVIDRAAILGNGERLEIDKALGVAADLSAARSEVLPAQERPVRAQGVKPLNDAIRRHIEGVLAITEGRVEGTRGAAALLEINPNTLRARMRKLGIDWRRFRRPC